MENLIQKLLSLFTNREHRAFNLDVVKTLISVSGVLATVVAGVGLFVTYNENNERLITDRFSKAVDQLGNDKLEIRLGGIYALERISKDSHKDELTVMEVLTAFVREHAKVSLKSIEKQTKFSTKKIKETQIASTQTSTHDEEIPLLATDIQAVLTVIGRRKLSYGGGQIFYLRLNGTNLQGANLEYSNLQNTNLMSVNLQQASLRGANLQGAILDTANLQGADLAGANLQGARYSDNSTSKQICNSPPFPLKHPCPTIFPENFDPKAAGMVLVK